MHVTSDAMLASKRMEFASDAWLEMADRLLRVLVSEQGEALGGESVAICQILTDPPAHLAGGSAELTWSLIIDGTKTKVVKGAVPNPDYIERAAFADIQKNARIFYDQPPLIFPKKTVERGSLDAVRNVLGQLLLKFHNELALRTA